MAGNHSYGVRTWHWWPETTANVGIDKNHCEWPENATNPLKNHRTSSETTNDHEASPKQPQQQQPHPQPTLTSFSNCDAGCGWGCCCCGCGCLGGVSTTRPWQNTGGED